MDAINPSMEDMGPSDVAPYAFSIMGRYRNLSMTEVVDTAPTRAEAERLLGEYTLAFGAGWALWLEEV